MSDLQNIEAEAYVTFDFWPDDYDESWPEDGEAKVYVLVEWPEEDNGIKLGLFCHYYVNGVDRTNELSPASYKEMLRQARQEFDKQQELETNDI
jgi:hypothetical protein